MRLDRRIRIATLFCLTLMPALLAAQQPGGGGAGEEPATAPPAAPVVVSATRLEQPAAAAASSVEVITAEELERRQIRTVADALRTVPGVDVTRNGGPGGQTSVFLRGAKSEHTLVMIDGVVVNDPISPGRSFNFAHLTTANVERIEVVRGPQSTLYGSDAIGGVVNIITRKGTGDPGGFAQVEYGSFDTLNADAGAHGASGAFRYSLAASRQQSGGISAADADLEGNSEPDGYENTTVSARLGWEPGGRYGAELILRGTDADSDLDNGGGPGNDDPNRTSETRRRTGRVQGWLSLLDHRWKQTLGYSLSAIEREGRNPPDSDHPATDTESRFEGSIRRADWQHDLVLTGRQTLVLGLEQQEERGRSATSFGEFPEKTARLNSAYVQHQFDGDAAFLTLGARRDDHSRFGGVTTYRVTAAWRFAGAGTRLRGSYGTGFKAPTLLQLFDGNRELEPEESIGWDAGVEQDFAGGAATLSLTYFENRLDNLIVFDFATGYRNTGEAETRGQEWRLQVRPAETLQATLTYTRLDTEDAEGKPLVRRAEQQAGLDVAWRPAAATTLTLAARHVGERDDLDFSTFPATRVSKDPYTVVGLAASQDVGEAWRLFGRVENVTDADYQEVQGFGTPGRSAYAGVRLRL